ncbi:MAG: hypothetical protein HQM10_13360 [Candidatus Riflebacteria bacterium]|nr:hypothetical protein [Candidatus Riflebacteria bacterium]
MNTSMIRLFMLGIIISTVLWLPLSANAQTGSSKLTISDDEKALYLKHKDQISEVAKKCLEITWATHLDFFHKWKVSKYYGDRNPKLDTREERLAIIRRVGAPDRIVDEMQGISCIGLTRQCLREGFEATKEPALVALWKRIDADVIANGVSGMVLLSHLQKLGWRILYWNPNPENNAKWDSEDPTLVKGKPVSWDSGVKDSDGNFIYHPSWGMHAYRYQTVMKKGMYYTIGIDDKDLLVGFGDKTPESFKEFPLFVGVAHAGYHVFPGARGKVIEAHSMRDLDSIDNLEVGEFNPLASKGSPRWTRIEKYRSGVVGIAP